MIHELAEMGLVFLKLFTGMLAVLYMQRKIYALRNYVETRPSLDDLWTLALVAFVVAITESAPLLHGILLTVVALGMLIMWLDAILVHFFGFEVNLNNIRLFFQGAESFSGDSKDVFSSLKKRSWFLAAPLAIIMLTISSFLDMEEWNDGEQITWSAFLALFLMGVTKSRFQLTGTTAWVGLAGLAYMVLEHLDDLPVQVWQQAFAWGGLLLLGLVVAIKVMGRGGSGRFYSARSPVRNFIQGARLNPDRTVQISEEDWQKYVALPLAPPAPSKAFGRCQGANVIVITMESLARDYIQPHDPDGADLPWLSALASKGIVSNNHYACCPNTNRAIQHIYQGNYPSASAYPFLSLMKACGYNTAYMMISRTRFFNLCDILSEIGFDRVLDRDTQKLDPARGDHAFMDQVEAVHESLGDGPFFLHLKNEQTHSPYQVIEKDRFNRHSGDTREAHFKNAAEEADSVMKRFLERLGQYRDLSNTLIVYTGDHGQSFGEFGYVSHSSASINSQVRVPLVMHHPALEKQVLQRSSHFDLMPTVLDLLGIECPSPVFGRSLMHGDNEQPLLLYSQTRKGNAPSNASLLSGNSKIMVDLIYGYRYQLDVEDNLRETMTPKQVAYYETLIHAAMDERGLINHSAFSPRQKTGGEL